MTGENIGFMLRQRAEVMKVNIADMVRITGLNDKTITKCLNNEGSTKQSTIWKISDCLGIKRIKYTVE